VLRSPTTCDGCGSALARLLVLAGCLVLAAGCEGRGEVAQAPAAPDSAEQPTGPAEPAHPSVALVEASGIAVRGGGKVAVIGGDELFDGLYAVSLDDWAVRWRLPFPRGAPRLSDVEGLAPWADNSVFAICSQSRTREKNRVKPERNRLALVTLTPDARHVQSVRVYEDLRSHLIGVLAAYARSKFDNPMAVTEQGPADVGINVEGIAVWKGQLLVGLRSPVARGGGAVVVPIRSPEKLLEPGAQRTPPDFGPLRIVPSEPGEGIRDMCADTGGILLILGPQGNTKEPRPRIVRWDPQTNEVKKLRVPGFKRIAKPEGIAVDPQGRLLIVQDQMPPLPQVLFRLEISPD
jgi:hypothetical protein